MTFHWTLLPAVHDIHLEIELNVTRTFYTDRVERQYPAMAHKYVWTGI